MNHATAPIAEIERVLVVSPDRFEFRCSTCSDTRLMTYGERLVMCTRCPLPCSMCRDGTAPYCANTGCRCACHFDAEGEAP